MEGGRTYKPRQQLMPFRRSSPGSLGVLYRCLFGLATLLLLVSASTVTAQIDPSLRPTQRPAVNPTGEPTFVETIMSRATFRQDFLLENCAEGFCSFNETEIDVLLGVLSSYTPMLDDDTSRVETECIFQEQTNEIVDDTFFTVSTVLDYACTYTSKNVDVSEFPDRLKRLINSDVPPTFLDLIRNQNLPVVFASEAWRRIISTPSPTVSLAPTSAPTSYPTVRQAPSQAPLRTNRPTGHVVEPVPSDPTQKSPTPEIIESNRSNLALIVSVSVVCGMFAGGVLTMLAYWFLKRYVSLNNLPSQ